MDGERAKTPQGKGGHKDRLSTFHELEALLKANGRGEGHGLRRVHEVYPWAATKYYLSLVDWSNPNDPIALQCIPSPLELDYSLPGSHSDPLAENRHMPVPGLVHRYRDRVLVMATGYCYAHCRHCNRKRNWRATVTVPKGEVLEEMRSYIARRPFIREVILSGGDPLTLSVTLLQSLLHAFRSIETVEVIRVGTRVPVVQPSALTGEVADLLAAYRPLWVNTHFNHPVEVTSEASGACERLLQRGIPVSNHTVLLKGVNDSAETLAELFTRLNRIMVRPYYLFHCDSASGTDHFRTDLRLGIEIMEELWGNVGGLCLPRYVVDLPEGGGKAQVMPSYLLGMEGDEAVFRTFEGKIVCYRGARGAVLK